MLSFSFFGACAVEYEGQPLPALRTSKGQALLVYVLIEKLASGQSAVRRETLMALLWPGMPEPSARQNLRQALYLVRQELPDVESKSGVKAPLLLADRNTIQINPQAVYSTDVAEFQRLIARESPEAWKQAIDLYRGDFLADFYLEDSNEFEAWAATHRARLRRLMADALSSLVDHYLAQAQYEEAEQVARRQLALDELQESAHRKLMEALAGSGRRTEALAQYDRLEQLLQQEMGVAPSLETQELALAIRTRWPHAVSSAKQLIRGYELREQIGEGGFGIVYRALQPGVGREVAVKAIHRRYADDADFIRRFEREAQLVARLEHPHIVPLYDYWREPGGAYLVMRWMRGGSLQQRLAVTGSWALEEVLRLVEQIAAALATAHRQLVIHRDIKPQNILLDEEGNAYLTDFGIAKRIGDETQQTAAGFFLGSTLHASPEQLLGEPLSPQSDLYSLGLVLYELLSGQNPYRHEPLGQLLVKKLNSPLPSLRAQRPELPPAVEAVLQQATALNPVARFPDPLALAAALRAATPAGSVAQGSALFRPQPATTRLDIPNPFKGLRPFEEADAALFFGRERLTERLVERLQQGRFLAVVGPSGSGKSSVVKAGLLPALRRGALPASNDWFISEMTPGTHPMEEMEAALLRVAVNAPSNLVTPLMESERGLVRVVKRILPPGKDELLLVIDQFEELFILTADEAVRRHFLQSLVAAARDSSSRIRVVITLRADFYDRPLLYQAFGELVEDCSRAVTPPTRLELAQTIRRPVMAVGAAVDEPLLASMVADVYDQPGALPLLQYALTELFEQRSSNLLTLAEYRSLGGLVGALTGRAEALYQELSPDGRQVARELFLRLVNLGEGAEDTRRQVLRSELLGLDGVGDEPQATSVVDHILNSYGRARLLSFDHELATREPTVEVAHEALLREWPRLRAWLGESRDNVRHQRRLALFAREWLESERDTGYLLRGSRLEQFSGWAANNDIALTQDEQAFLAASLAAREDRLAQEQTRRREAERQAQLASARELGAASLVNLERDPELSILLALKSLERVQTYEGENALHRALIATPVKRRLRGHTAPVYAAAFSPDGRRLATAGGMEQTCRIWDTATGRELHVLKGHTDAVSVATFSPDGESVATAGDDGTVRIWNAANGALLNTFSVGEHWVIDIAFSPDGRYLLAGTNDGAVEVMDVAAAQMAFRLNAHAAPVMQVAFSPDGAVLGAAYANGSVELWRANDGDHLRTIPHAGAGIRFSPRGSYFATYNERPRAPYLEPVIFIWNLEDVLASGAATPLFTLHRVQGGSGTSPFAFTGNGQWLVALTRDKVVRVWDATSGASFFDVVPSVDGPLNLAVSVAGDRVAVCGEGHDVEICHLTPGREFLTLQAHRDQARKFAFNNDGSRLYSPGWDGTVGIWNVNPRSNHFGEKLRTLGDGESRYYAASIDPSERRITTINRNGLITVWDAQGGEALLEITDKNSMMRSFALSPDGSCIASGSFDGAVRLWDAGTGREIRGLTGHADIVYNVVFSPDGSLLASASGDMKAHVWDAAAGAKLLSLEHNHWVHALAFSPEGQFLATAGNEGLIRVWDLRASLSDGYARQVLAIKAHPNMIPNLAYSPDGSLLASSSMDKTVRVWNAKTGRERLTLTGAQSTAWGVAFSPDGRYLAASSWDGMVRLYVLDLAELIPLAHARLTRPLTQEECGRYLHQDDCP